MKTKKPIATISYNTEPFLQHTLDELVNDRLIESWSYVRHYAEEDEKKDHVHLFVEPAKSIDTSVLLSKFIEPLNIDEPPLSCMPFRSSKFFDWFFYTKHDIDYLASKGQFRRHHYKQEHFVFSNVEYYNEIIRQLDTRGLTAQTRFLNAIADGFSFAEILRLGIVPLNAVISYKKAYDILKTDAYGSEMRDIVNECTVLFDTELTK